MVIRNILDSYSGVVQGQLAVSLVKNTVSSLYVHFPFCKHLCNYCDFYKKIPSSNFEIEEFEKNLKQYLKLNAILLKQQRLTFKPLKTLYIGGGTPSLWKPEGLGKFLIELSNNQIELSPDTEFTLEINPGTLGENPKELLLRYMDIGVNRFSMGSQTLNPSLLPLLDRVHSLDEVYQALEVLESLNCNYSVDLMLGLPDSAKYKRNIESELDELIKYCPSHFSVYILTTKSNYKYQEILPTEEYIEEEYLKVSQKLSEHGFNHYEVSNFALEKKESKHNMQYWLSRSVAAIGPSATGLLHSTEFAIRYKWNGGGQVAYEVERLDKKTLRLEDIYLKLRLNIGISFGDLSVNLCEKGKFDRLVEGWCSKGLANFNPINQGIFLTAKGFLLQDSLLGEIFSAFKTL